MALVGGQTLSAETVTILKIQIINLHQYLSLDFAIFQYVLGVDNITHCN